MSSTVSVLYIHQRTKTKDITLLTQHIMVIFCVGGCNLNRHQLARRLISFVFCSVSSIYPQPAEGREGNLAGPGARGRAQPDTRALIPHRKRFYYQASLCLAPVITFLCARSSSEESDTSLESSGWRIYAGLVQPTGAQRKYLP